MDDLKWFQRISTNFMKFIKIDGIWKKQKSFYMSCKSDRNYSIYDFNNFLR